MYVSTYMYKKRRRLWGRESEMRGERRTRREERERERRGESEGENYSTKGAESKN